MPKVPDRRVPELLAPAGGPDALRAAVNNGADAVYLGVGELNARRGAENFTAETLAEATRYAHLRMARVYLTANVVIRPDEMAAALELVDTAWAAGVDAVIVQDLGLARVITETMPYVRMHASTQINAHNTATVRELARMGFRRVTLARELSLGEIEAVCSGVDVEVETFVHGALCLAYSGGCLLSSVVGGRSANRGACAQPCRLPYELLDDAGRLLKTPGRHLMSPKDLAGITHLPQLIGAGVNALKIEGRMKSAEYVAVVTGVYRAALDRAAADPEGYSVTDAELDTLAEVFSRGFTTGYLDGIGDDSIIAFNRPNNRGVPVGRVSERSTDGRAVLSLERAIEAGDALEFWTGKGRFAQRVSTMELDGRSVSAAPAGARVAITPEKRVREGDRVFRVANAALEAAARRTYVGDDGGRTVPARIGARVMVGEPLEVRIDAAGHSAVAKGPVIEQARTKALTAAEVMEHVGRLGSTALRAEGYDIDLDPEAGAGFSLLHRVRREAVEQLEAAMLAEYSSRTRTMPDAPQPRGASRRGRAAKRDMPELVVWTTRPAVARACRAAGAHQAIVPEWALAEEDVPDPVLTVEMPRVVRDCETEDILASLAGRSSVAGNLGMLGPAASHGGEVWAHWGLNVSNPWAVDAVGEAGAAGAWLSPELSGRDAGRIVREGSLPVGLAVLGRQEVMVTEHCLIAAGVSCSKRCATCPHRERWYALRDRKGYGFPVISDAAGRSHVFNAVPLDLTRALPEIVASGVSAVRYDITVEHLQEAQHLTARLRAALEAAVAGRPTSDDSLYPEGTAGHFFRGVR